MNHTDHVHLIKDGVSGSLWADFGSGTGAFTLALAELLQDKGEIYSVDRDSSALKQQIKALQAQFPRTKVHYLTADFARPLEMPALDGILMANSLHFHQDKSPILQLICGYLKPSGKLILVEYNTDKGNTWVPYPLSLNTWVKLAEKNGFSQTRLLVSRPSRFLGEIYSAVSLNAQ
ncbi:MAG: class I SAM-dependent methyltransferase [Anaerolineae bacterium]|nr:class I SAM-dependent methyltransferase [Anaerolineae bacterium]